jgi:cytochrome c oxidase assembly factor CtaG
MYSWHTSALHDAAVRHAGIHALQHLCFIAIGANMWMALFGPFPRPAWFSPAWQCAYIVAVRLIGAVLGNVLVFGGHPFYDVYAHGEAYWHMSPDADQTAAGAVMMVWESILTMCLFAWIFMRSGAETIERQELIELAAARGVDVTPERADRAVAAGRGGDLRKRIEDVAAANVPDRPA